MYVLGEGVEANALYEMGLERIGCWPCPATDVAEMEAVGDMHPELWARWRDALAGWGMSQEDISRGTWRWRRPGEGGVGPHHMKGLSYEVEGERVVGRVAMDFERAREMAKALGCTPTPAGEGIEFDGIVVREDGSFEFEAGDGGDRARKLGELYALSQRSLHCFGCGLCLGQCGQGAVEMTGGRIYIRDTCTSCRACHRRCPIVRYGAGGAGAGAGG
ncbi:MAG: hypothetical protein GXO65_01155 [Euryarchaeota archaeon]|nr:hypothetical protein [Euryarchaeota archaeon]